MASLGWDLAWQVASCNLACRCLRFLFVHLIIIKNHVQQMHPQFACAQRLQVPLDCAAAQKQNLHFMERVSLEVLQANVRMVRDLGESRMPVQKLSLTVPGSPKFVTGTLPGTLTCIWHVP